MSMMTSTKKDPLLRICADKCLAADPLAPERTHHYECNFMETERIIKTTERIIKTMEIIIVPALRLIIPGIADEWPGTDVSTVIFIGIWAYGVLAIVGLFSL